MSDLSAFPITRKWPAEHPDRLQLYSLPTPNGVKVSIMLEELGLPYEPHLVSFERNDQMSPEFLSLNPNNKIPAILDPNGPDGKPLALFESGAILVYLADKTDSLLAPGASGRYETLQWLMFQMGGIGPMFGQIGFFNKFAGKDYEDKRPLQRYVDEAKRLLAVLDGHLEGREWIMGERYTIADIATFPWIRNLVGFYEAGELVGFENFQNVKRVLERFLARPAVQRGLNIPKRD
ncbi:glutathione binding-like protein [Pseudomonas sp. NY15435]|uniref:glutathione binding-like protein n=1 Tax=Pseudomonas sp. NY15435 TaxID=3400358 RepID=UPI003A8536B8